MSPPPRSCRGQLKCHLAADVSERQFHDVHAQGWFTEPAPASPEISASDARTAARGHRLDDMVRRRPPVLNRLLDRAQLRKLVIPLVGAKSPLSVRRRR